MKPQICVLTLQQDAIIKHCQPFRFDKSIDGHLQSAIGLALSSDGHVVVADCSSHALQVFRCSNGAWARKIGGEGSNPGCFKKPRAVAFDGDDTIIVADTENHRVQIMRFSDGSYLRTIGCEGRENGQFIRPCSVAVDGSGNVLVYDGSGRIQVFRVSDGQYLRSMCGPGQLRGFDGSLVFEKNDGGEGTIFVADGPNGRIQVLRYSDGAHLHTITSEFKKPCGIAFVDGTSKFIAVTDAETHKVHILTRINNGRVRSYDPLPHQRHEYEYKWTPGHILDNDLFKRLLDTQQERDFWRMKMEKPYGIVTDGKGRIFISNFGGSCILVFDHAPA